MSLAWQIKYWKSICVREYVREAVCQDNRVDETGNPTGVRYSADITVYIWIPVLSSQNKMSEMDNNEDRFL